eukprot:TRINITY_DN3894_c0_g4_i1.p1 TRINITY_DN3894_c0_g4~~TRINITY_DN3894_c0_g4_i1.p1  ORF type:complete len:158 (+),score=27.42 TRINITY_DN3894_c0_g4_i1:88-561(+)
MSPSPLGPLLLLPFLLSIVIAGHYLGEKCQSEICGFLVIVKAFPPAASYEGGIDSFPATAPSESASFRNSNSFASHNSNATTSGAKFDSQAWYVQKYVRHLENHHHQLLQAMGISAEQKKYSYKYAINGFFAHLTQAEADRLAEHDDVGLVMKDLLR